MRSVCSFIQKSEYYLSSCLVSRHSQQMVIQLTRRIVDVTYPEDSQVESRSKYKMLDSGQARELTVESRHVDTLDTLVGFAFKMRADFATQDLRS